jgi:hypothetical protein
MVKINGVYTVMKGMRKSEIKAIGNKKKIR